jgi:outer membrane receptor protein involved in Fe transport
MRACIFSFFIAVLSIQSIFSQVFTGKVLNNLGKPLEGAYVFHNEGNTHVHTDAKGLFTIENAAIGHHLKISHIGYETVEIVINTNEELIVVLNEKTISLNEVLIMPKINALNVFANISIETNPVKSSQEILQKVPGVIIGQHAGGGKAEQIFLRGFDLDHGTDIAITVDDMPVNMVSHAHGQGYADLHFLIPETIKRIDFGKGPYYANKGNFNTAGYVGFETKDHLESSSIKAEIGEFNYARLLTLLNLLNKENEAAYFTAEYITNDGAFVSPQNFNRINLFAKYTANLANNDKIALLLSSFYSKWDASGQIPQRAVDSGLISRFGAIDDTEGGETGRTNFRAAYTKYLDENSFVKNTVYYSKYDFELYSNFTFFLEDPVNGDQIKQKENRSIFGISSEYNKKTTVNANETLWQIGVGLRHDEVKNNELSGTLNRKELRTQIALGNVFETNLSAYANAEFNFGKFLFNPALRYDYFKFQYNDALLTNYNTQSETKGILSPKLNFLYNYSPQLQLYLKTGKGFHSNDTRVVVAQNGKSILPAAYGADFGFIWKPNTNLFLNAALWYLHLDQEFVYVGDAGIVEPSGKSERKGIDFGLRYQLNNWAFFHADLNYAYARATEEPNGEDYIPLAPDLTFTGGMDIIHPKGFFGSLNFRHIQDRPANEDNSIVAKGYFVTDINAGYKINNHLTLGFYIENLFDTQWNETQFATETRLFNETNSVEEIHFIPGTPFNFRGFLKYNF